MREETDVLIAQITDLHLNAGAKQPCQNTPHLRAVLNDIKNGPNPVDAIIVTGDLTENGHPASYEALKSELSSVDIPYYLALGNHDNAVNMGESFPQAPFADGFLNYSIDDNALRLIILDTTLAGRHGGAFCERRAAWLEAELSKAPPKPTLIAMHHPPSDIGIDWMTTANDAPWAKRFKSVIQKHDNIVQIICGHIHRAIFGRFGKTAFSVAGAVSPQVSLNLSPINPDKADGRVLIEDSPPSYALHHWKNGTLTTHHVQPNMRPLVRYDAAHAHIIKTTLDKN